MLKKYMSNANDIILVPFPLTNLSSQKIRPALQLSNLSDSDVIFCAISTKKHSSFDIPVKPNASNGLKRTSYIRTNKIATIEQKLVLAKLGVLGTLSQQKVRGKLQRIFGL